MINPFTLMHKGFIEAFQSRKTVYLVLQNFTLEDNLFKQEGKSYVLVSHYADKGKALEHFDKIKNDAMADRLNLNNEEQRQRFLQMLEPTSPYVLYSVIDSNKKATDAALSKQLKYNIQQYIAKEQKWHIPRNYEMVPRLKIIFGVLHVLLQFGSHEIKVPLRTLENYK